MPATTFPTTVPPSRTSPGKEVTYDILEANFGDGYSQRSGAGINTERVTWSLIWENIDNADAEEIETFLNNTKGYIPFYWTAPLDDGPKLWVLDGSVAVSSIFSLSRTVTVKFKRWFGATPA